MSGFDPTAMLEHVNGAVRAAIEPGSPCQVLEHRLALGGILGLPDAAEIEAVLRCIGRVKGLAVALRATGTARQDPRALADLLDEWLAPAFEAPVPS